MNWKTLSLIFSITATLICGKALAQNLEGQECKRVWSNVIVGYSEDNIKPSWQCGPGCYTMQRLLGLDSSGMPVYQTYCVAAKAASAESANCISQIVGYQSDGFPIYQSFCGPGPLDNRGTVQPEEGNAAQ